MYCMADSIWLWFQPLKKKLFSQVFQNSAAKRLASYQRAAQCFIRTFYRFVHLDQHDQPSDSNACFIPLHSGAGPSRLEQRQILTHKQTISTHAHACHLPQRSCLWTVVGSYAHAYTGRTRWLHTVGARLKHWNIAFHLKFDFYLTVAFTRIWIKYFLLRIHVSKTVQLWIKKDTPKAFSEAWLRYSFTLVTCLFAYLITWTKKQTLFMRRNVLSSIHWSFLGLLV